MRADTSAPKRRVARARVERRIHDRDERGGREGGTFGRGRLLGMHYGMVSRRSNSRDGAEIALDYIRAGRELFLNERHDERVNI